MLLYNLYHWTQMAIKKKEKKKKETEVIFKTQFAFTLKMHLYFDKGICPYCNLTYIQFSRYNQNIKTDHRVGQQLRCFKINFCPE